MNVSTGSIGCEEGINVSTGSIGCEEGLWICLLVVLVVREVYEDIYW